MSICGEWNGADTRGAWITAEGSNPPTRDTAGGQASLLYLKRHVRAVRDPVAIDRADDRDVR